MNRHFYHLVDPSPWPFYMSIFILMLTIGLVLYFHFKKLGLILIIWAFFFILLIMYIWWRDVIREGTYEGKHTLKVQQGLKYGMILFIVSEVMFFFAFFWAFFHSSLAPCIEIGSTWPPVEMINTIFDPWGIPLLNTLILLSSGLTVTWAHHFLVKGNRLFVLYFLGLTILFALLFTLFQAIEYFEAPFTISSGIYGSTFFMATGFHGFHVIIGTIFLIVSLVRTFFYHFSKEEHFGFEAAAWYWHFVDVVWLFLFVAVYWWGSIL